jgi:hypothetical protein
MALRLDYCHLWKAIFTGDRAAVEKYSRRMGAGEHHEIFSVILTFRPLDTGYPHETHCDTHRTHRSACTHRIVLIGCGGTRQEHAPGASEG